MKKLLLLVALFIGFTTISFAQMTKGAITYSMTFTSDNPDMATAVGMMLGSKMSLAFIPGKMRSEVAMGTMGSMTTISDDKSKKALMLMDMMGMKYAVETDIDKTDEAANTDYKVEITNESKDILGFKCKKAILTSDDPETGTITMWFTDKIEASTTGHNYFNKDMPGFPMSFSINQNDMMIDLTATSINKTADKDLFDMSIPEGYELKTEEELMLGQ